jgi:hypothetical protein
MVTSSGVVTVTNGFRLNANSIDSPRIVGGAEGFFLLWRESVVNQVRGARISSAGVVLDPFGVHLGPLPSAEGALGSDGSNHVFVASQYDPVSGTSPTFRWRIAQGNASVSSAAKIADANTPANQFSLAFNGSRFLLITRHGSSNAAFFLNPDGTLLGPGPALADTFYSRQVTSSRGDFFILSQFSFDRLDFSRYSGTGVLLATNSLRLSQDSENSFVSGLHLTLLFRKDANTDELLATVLRPDGSVRSQFSPQGPNQQDGPTVISDGSSYLAAWSESRDGSNIVYALRVDANGNPLALAPLFCGEGRDVRAGYSSGIFLMAWASANGSVVCRRLRRNGDWLDPNPLVISTNGFGPAVAGGLTNFFVAWDYSTNTGFFLERKVRGMVIGTNEPPGASPPFEISFFGPRLQSDPAILFNGTNYLVAWSVYQPSFFYAYVAWRFFSSGGQLLPGGGITPVDSSSPCLTSDGDSVWLGWSHFQFHSSIADSRVAQLSTDGTSLIPSDGAIVDIFPQVLAGVAGKVWSAGTVSSFITGNFRAHVAFTAFNSPSNLAVAPFLLEESSDQPFLTSNGTNLLCAYRSPNLSSDNPGTPRVRLRAIYPDTTLRLTRGAGLRLTGSAQHPFLIEQSTDLILWQPYRTNTVPGAFDYPVTTGIKQFFRLTWYPP